MKTRCSNYQKENIGFSLDMHAQIIIIINLLCVILYLDMHSRNDAREKKGVPHDAVH